MVFGFPYDTTSWATKAEAPAEVEDEAPPDGLALLRQAPTLAPPPPPPPDDAAATPTPGPPPRKSPAPGTPP